MSQGRKIPSSSILNIDAVTVSFDGFRALNELSLQIDRGEMRAIIGPNGAGKTTMMDVITGRTVPDLGAVVFDGHLDLLRRDEAEIAELEEDETLDKSIRLELPAFRSKLFGKIILARTGRGARRRRRRS